MSHRPLPTIIGLTENTLRALLARTLGASHIDSYEEWVFLNLTAGQAPVEQIAVALRGSPRSIEAVAADLHAKGLVAAGGGLTDTGRQHLEQGRALVSTMTSRLTTGLEPDQERICAEVLDAIRDRAERELHLNLNLGN